MDLAALRQLGSLSLGLSKKKVDNLASSSVASSYTNVSVRKDDSPKNHQPQAASVDYTDNDYQRYKAAHGRSAAEEEDDKHD